MKKLLVLSILVSLLLSFSAFSKDKIKIQVPEGYLQITAISITLIGDENFELKSYGKDFEGASFTSKSKFDLKSLTITKDKWRFSPAAQRTDFENMLMAPEEPRDGPFTFPEVLAVLQMSIVRTQDKFVEKNALLTEVVKRFRAFKKAAYLKMYGKYEPKVEGIVVNNGTSKMPISSASFEFDSGTTPIDMKVSVNYVTSEANCTFEYQTDFVGLQIEDITAFDFGTDISDYEKCLAAYKQFETIAWSDVFAFIKANLEDTKHEYEVTAVADKFALIPEIKSALEAADGDSEAVEDQQPSCFIESSL